MLNNVHNLQCELASPILVGEVVGWVSEHVESIQKEGEKKWKEAL